MPAPRPPSFPPHRSWAPILLPPLTLLVVDLVVLAGLTGLAIWLRLWFGGQFDPIIYLRLWPALALFPVLFAGLGLYAHPPHPPSGELKRWVQGVSLGFLVLTSATFLSRDAEAYSRLAFAMAWGFSVLVGPFARATLRSLTAGRPWWNRLALVVGGSDSLAPVLRSIRGNPGLSITPVGILCPDPDPPGDFDGLPVVSGAEAIQVACDRFRPHLVILTGNSLDREAAMALWHGLADRVDRIIVVPRLLDMASLWVEARDIGGTLGLEVRQNLLRPGRAFVKRTIDLLFTCLGALLALPLFILLAVAIAIDSRGGILYGQARIGRQGQTFKAWKFRSMHADADAVLKRHLDAAPALREEWDQFQKLRRDPRVTRIGRLLRRTSLDELPQIWNILRGDMSLVGPRPIQEAEIVKYAGEFSLYTKVRPGLTGLWQVSGRNTLTYPERVTIDAYYVRNWSVWLDLFILAKTVRVVLRGEGAY